MVRYVSLITLVLATVIALGSAHTWSVGQEQGDVVTGIGLPTVQAQLPAAPGLPGAPTVQSQAPNIPRAQWFGPPQPGAAADPRLSELSAQYNRLEMQVFTLVQRYRALSEGDQDERAKIHEEIVGLTVEQFDLRSEARRLEVERLSQQLHEVEAKLDRRLGHKDQIVQQRVSELTDQENDLGWESFPGAGLPNVFTTPYSPAVSFYPGRYVPAPPTAPGWPQPSSLYPAGQVGRAPTVGTARPAPRGLGGATGIQSFLDAAARERRAASDPAPAGESVAESAARMYYAEQRFAATKAQFDQGVISQADIMEAERNLELARLAYERAKREHAHRVRLLEIELQQAEAELAGVQTELEELTQAAAPAAKMWPLQRQLTQRQADVDRARAMLELHAEEGDGGQPQRKSPDEPRR